MVITTARRNRGVPPTTAKRTFFPAAYSSVRLAMRKAPSLQKSNPRWHENEYQQTHAYADRAYTDTSRSGSGGRFQYRRSMQLAQAGIDFERIADSL